MKLNKVESAVTVLLLIILMLLFTVMLSAMPSYDESSLSSELSQIEKTPSPIPDFLSEDVPIPTPYAYPTPIPTVEPEINPELNIELRPKDELLILVNPWNYLPEDYEIELALVNDDGEEWQYMDSRCADALLEMVYDCAAAGNAPYICSGYRTMEKQQYLFSNRIARFIDEGYAPEDAPALAAQVVAVPGTSEHQLGLAADIIDYYYPYLNHEQENTSTQHWLMENSWRYGFILRYPNDKSDITGIIYEPWHYRYVGKAAAKEIYELGVTLEEYLELFYEP